MNNTIVRSLIAGSFSAVASLVILGGGGTTLASGGGCDPIYTDYGDGLASIAYPDFCDDTIVAPLFPIDLLPMPIGVDLLPTQAPLRLSTTSQWSKIPPSDSGRHDGWAPIVAPQPFG